MNYTTLTMDGQTEGSAATAIAPNPQDWKAVVAEHFPALVPIVEVCLANVCALLLRDLSNCPALVLVGQPSSLKTTALDFIQTDFTYQSDNFTPRSFVSHAANVDKQKLTTEVDLLPKLKHKVLLVKDLSPIFSRRIEDLEETIGILTRVLDGRGYQSDSGVHGSRGYKGEFLFGMLAATTPPDSKVWKVMSRLGPRLLFLAVDSQQESEEEQLQMFLSPLTYREKVDCCQKAVSTYLNQLWEYHGGFGGLEWDRAAGDKEILMALIRLAALGVKLRAQLPKEKDFGNESYDYIPGIIEGPDRYRMLLFNLARGHAVLQGRKSLAIEDIKVAVRVTMSSASEERRRLIQAVLGTAEPISCQEAAKAIGCSDPTARIVANEMAKLGILTMPEGIGAMKITLAPEHEWLRKLFDGV